jgi:hypothetical protein
MFDMKILKPKERFLFGERGEMLFSDNVYDTNDKSFKLPGQKAERLMLEKNFTRKPYA